MTAEWSELLGGFAPVVWGGLVLLACAWTFIPFWIYVDSRSRSSSPWPWVVAVAVPPALGVPIAIIFASRLFPLLALGILVIPVAVTVGYLIRRVSTPVCPECGSAMRPEWRFCPRHPQRLGAVVGGSSPSPVPGIAWDMPAPFSEQAWMVPPPSPSRLGGSPGSRAVESDGAALLVVRDGPDNGRQFSLSSSGAVLGRDASADVSLSDGSASGRHAQISFNGSRAQLIDLGSTNGTFVNNESVDHAFLYDGDLIHIGDTTLVFKELR